MGITCNSTFTRTKLRNVCLLTSSGGTPSRKQPEYFCAAGDGHLWVKSKELLDHSISATEENITNEGIENSSAKYYPANTILLAMYGANVGQLGWLKKEATINQAICGMIVNDKVADWRYVFYAIMAGRHELVAKAFGAAQQNLNQDIIRDFEIPLPSLSVQQKVSSILSAYDDLIENDSCRIKILEEMAQRIYREWFVDFRYPGHENDKLVDSELGMIPEGWEITSVSEAVELNPRLTVPKDTSKPYVPMAGLNPGSMLIVDYEMRTGNSGAKFQNGDTLMARITPSLEHGKTAFVQFLGPDQAVAIGSTEFNVMRSRTVNPYFVYCLARNKDLRECAIKSMVGASGRQRVQPECFDTFRFPHPCRSLLSLFAETVEPTFKLIQRLWEKTLIFRQTRDLLLPKLISGELDVSEMDIETGEGRNNAA